MGNRLEGPACKQWETMGCCWPTNNKIEDGQRFSNLSKNVLLHISFIGWMNTSKTNSLFGGVSLSAGFIF